MNLDGAAIILAIIAVLWAGYERFKAGRQADGDYVESLATAAHELVELYQGQAATLQLEISRLRSRMARLERIVQAYGCGRLNCLDRLPIPKAILEIKKSNSETRPISR